MTSPQSVKPIQSAEKLANAYGISSQALIEVLTNIEIDLFIEAAFCKVVVASAVFLCSHFQCRLLPLWVQCDGPDGLPIPRRA